MSVHVVAVITAKPGSEDAVRAAMRDIVGPTRDEEGCLSYDLSESAAAPGTFVTVEEWRES
ncbi:MAG: antibiotic biosynthesis monooxygenase, partial [Actinomycetota bacterium]|nr:antibiotic biosynthesis monooxygenase [Actinomycetota bacterium]